MHTDKNRRNFLKLAGLGIAVSGFDKTITEQAVIPRAQKFNMCGYAAPKLEKVRIGFVGLGNRGMAAVERLNKIES
jgi:hypothetical protein